MGSSRGKHCHRVGREGGIGQSKFRQRGDYWARRISRAALPMALAARNTAILAS